MPPPMTPAQARVADPVLTTVARGYRNDAFASTHLFPKVPVGARGGKIVSFAADDFADVDSRRAPGENRRRVSFGYKGEDYALTQHALDGQLPIENLQEAMATPGIDMGMATTRKTANVVELRIEIEAAALATTAANYDAGHTAALAAGSRWDSEDDQDPAAKVEEMKETIAQDIGQDPNVLVCGHPVVRQLKRNAKVIDQIKYTRGLQDAEMGQQLVTNAMLAAYFGVEHFVDAMVRKGEAGNFEYVWGSNVVLAYSDLSSLADMGSPSFGYCYRLLGYPIAGPAWFDARCDSWIYPYTSEDSPVIAGKGGGYLLRTVVD